MVKIEEWISRMRGKDWNPLLDKLHIGTVRLLMCATLGSGVYTVWAMYKWKQDIDFRKEVKINKKIKKNVQFCVIFFS